MLKPVKRIPVKKIIAAAAAVVIAAGSVIAYMRFSGNGNRTQATENVSEVTRGNVELTISGSGTVEPYERYEIIPHVNGEIISCPYEVGDYVEAGDVVYSSDMSDALLDLEKQNNSMEKSTITYNNAMSQGEKLTIKAPADGRITMLSVSEGDEVNANDSVAAIKDDVNLTVKIPFNGEQINYISKGSTATLSSSEQMSNFSGTVTYVDSIPSASSDGSSVYYVTVEFTNPGAVYEGAALGAQINGQIKPGVRYGFIWGRNTDKK